MSFASGVTHAEAHLSAGTKARVAIVALIAVAIALAITAARPGPVLGSPDLLIDPTFGLPTPPRDLPYNATGSFWATLGMTILGVGGVVLGIYDSLRKRTLLPLMIALSGAAIVIPEVFFDVMGAVYYPWVPQTLAFKILGREMPWMIVAAWFGYGAFLLVIFKILEARARTTTLWLLWVFMIVSGIGFEEILIRFGTYHYYGNQPLVILRYLGWWWCPCNTVGVMLAAALAYRYRESLRGWRSLSVLLLTPMAVGGVYGFIAMPSWIVVNGYYPWLITQSAGLLTDALGVVAFCFVLDLVLDRRPFVFRARGPEIRENEETSLRS